MASELRDYKLARLASKGRRRLHSEDDNDEFVSHQQGRRMRGRDYASEANLNRAEVHDLKMRYRCA